MITEDQFIQALRDHGCRPRRVSTGRWIAICPCCNLLNLTIGGTSPVTKEERDEWFDAQAGGK